jgi:hypothetical protein
MDRAQFNTTQALDQNEIGNFDNQTNLLNDVQLAIVGGGIADTIPV